MKVSTYAEKKWGDCSQAVAYSLNFVQMCYTTNSYDEFFSIPCKTCETYKQEEDYRYSKSGFSKKDYYRLDFGGYGVSENLKVCMLDFGVPEKNFRPIYDKRHKAILGYQLTCDKILPSVSNKNGFLISKKCESCGHITYVFDYKLKNSSVYNGLGYPEYTTKEAISYLDVIASPMENRKAVYISLNLYRFLIEKYPRLECRPVFIGDVYDDPEYIRIKNSKE